MFELNKILSLTAEEIIIVNALDKVAEEARADAKKIAEAYHFSIGQEEIEVYHDRDCNNFEYLTHSGIWKARYLHQSYDVKVDFESIYELYRAEWLIENGYAKETVNGFLTEFGKKKEACSYFREFVRKIPDKVPDVIPDVIIR